MARKECKRSPFIRFPSEYYLPRSLTKNREQMRKLSPLRKLCYVSVEHTVLVRNQHDTLQTLFHAGLLTHPNRGHKKDDGQGVHVPERSGSNSIFAPSVVDHAGFEYPHDCPARLFLGP